MPDGAQHLSSHQDGLGAMQRLDYGVGFGVNLLDIRMMHYMGNVGGQWGGLLVGLVVVAVVGCGGGGCWVGGSGEKG
jgi:hypothetical protein